MDDARQTAFNFAAPAGERQAAMADLTRVHLPTAADLIPAGDIRAFASQLLEMHADQEQMAKAQVIDLSAYRQRATSGPGMKSVYLDEMQIFSQGDWYEKPAPTGFEMLRAMVDQTPILSAILLTRQRQMDRFCIPQERGDASQPGFTITHVDPEHQPSEAERKVMRAMSRFMVNGGAVFDARKRKILKRDTFTTFMRKLTRDSLSMDAATIETEFSRDKSKGISGFYAVDGATIRLCDEHGYQGDDRYFAVQLMQGRPVTAYTHHDLIYEPRNPRTDVRLAGYGMGEAELLVRVVTGYLNAMTYNLKGFDANAIPRGILQLVGEYDSMDLDAFKRMWNATVKGINNAWSMPVMTSKDPASKAEFTPFGVEFSEMYFAKWMTFLTSVACAIYGMSPAEINSDSFTSGNTSALSGSDTNEKLAHSADSGLRPLLAHFEGVLSDFIVQDINIDAVKAEMKSMGENLGGIGEVSLRGMCLRFTGLDPEDQDKVHEKKKLVMTVNEMRAEMNMKKAEGDWGDAPLNPSLLGAWQAEQQAGQEDYGQMPGGGDGGGQPLPGEGQDGQPGGQDEDPRQHGDFGQPAGAPAGEFGKAFPIWGPE